MIKVLIVDDQQIVREGMTLMLSLDDEIKVIGTAENGKKALDCLNEQPVDVVLMDIRMPIMDGLRTTREIRRKGLDVKVIILTTFDEEELILESIASEAAGFLLKDSKSQDIIRAIKEVRKGNGYLDPKVTNKVFHKLAPVDRQGSCTDRIERLTERELEIAKLIGKGLSNREIARTLFITEGTVKNHITNILQKLEARDRINLALMINEI